MPASTLRPVLPPASLSARSRLQIGVALSGLIGLTMLAVFAAILMAPWSDTAPTGTTGSPDVAHLIRMGLVQAGLSTLLAITTGMAIAWSLNRLSFPGKTILTALFASAIVTPGIVIAAGLINVWGRRGWAAEFYGLLGLDWSFSLFGLHGILLAHTLLNGAFAAHLFLARLNAIPSHKLKIARSLGLSSLTRVTVLDVPALAGALPSLAAIIFLLTFTSFPIVMLLGGGPANQTLEVAIYGAIRFSFDLKGAALLALVQLAICTAIVLPATLAAAPLAPAGNASGHTHAPLRSSTPAFHWPDPPLITALQGLILLLGATGFALPLLALLAKGLAGNLPEILTSAPFIRALLTSLGLGSLSAILTVVVAVQLSRARAGTSSPLVRAALSLPVFAYLVMPSVVLSFGFFVLVRLTGLPNAPLAPAILVTANILLAVPFAHATLSPPLSAIHQRYDRLATSLRMSNRERWKWVEAPLLGRELGLAAALSFCFSLGDLGVISLFGTQQFTTLPWLMFRAMGAYRTMQAATIAALILVLCLAVFWALPPLVQKALANAQT